MDKANHFPLSSSSDLDICKDGLVYSYVPKQMEKSKPEDVKGLASLGKIWRQELAMDETQKRTRAVETTYAYIKTQVQETKNKGQVLDLSVMEGMVKEKDSLAWKQLNERLGNDDLKVEPCSILHYSGEDRDVAYTTYAGYRVSAT